MVGKVQRVWMTEVVDGGFSLGTHDPPLSIDLSQSLKLGFDRCVAALFSLC